MIRRSHSWLLTKGLILLIRKKETITSAHTLHSNLWEYEIENYVRHFRTEYVFNYKISKLMPNKLVLKAYTVPVMELTHRTTLNVMTLTVLGDEIAMALQAIAEYTDEIMNEGLTRVQEKVIRLYPKSHPDALEELRKNWDKIWKGGEMQDYEGHPFVEYLSFASRYCHKYLYERDPETRLNEHFNLYEVLFEVKRKLHYQELDAATASFTIKGFPDMETLKKWLELKDNRIALYKAALTAIVKHRKSRLWKLIPSQMKLDTAQVTSTNAVVITFFLKKPKIRLTKKGRDEKFAVDEKVYDLLVED